mgnify:CR=1 FL=1
MQIRMKYRRKVRNMENANITLQQQTLHHIYIQNTIHLIAFIANSAQSYTNYIDCAPNLPVQ